jgi:hypothetical protein
MNDTARVVSVANQVNNVVKKGHSEIRIMLTKKRERNKQWYIDNKDRRALAKKEYAEKHNAIYDKEIKDKTAAYINKQPARIRKLEV